MLALSQTTGYAILALGCLDGCRGRLVLAREIAACTGTPLPYLSKLLHALCLQGLIEGKRGYRGGFVLSRPADQISLLEVAEAVEGQSWLPECLLGLAECSALQCCPTHEFWVVERQRIEEKLRTTTVADVAAFARQRGLVGSEGFCKHRDGVNVAFLEDVEPAEFGDAPRAEEPPADEPRGKKRRGGRGS
jgi:Rrf2 family transcriptional regulator, iron-sulfur cluster assembly transcription factor